MPVTSLTNETVSIDPANPPPPGTIVRCINDENTGGKLIKYMSYMVLFVAFGGIDHKGRRFTKTCFILGDVCWSDIRRLKHLNSDMTNSNLNSFGYPYPWDYDRFEISVSSLVKDSHNAANRTNGYTHTNP